MIDPNAKFVINASILTGHTLHWENGIIKIYNRFGMLDTAFRAADMPTVEAVEVVHGQWIEDDETIYCSACGFETSSLLPYVCDGEKWVPCYANKYCGNCGAKMDGGTK